MSMRERIHAWSAPRWAWGAACCLPVLIVFVLAVSGGSVWMGYVFAAMLGFIAAAVIAWVEIKRQIQRQKSADSRYKAIIDQANDGVVIVDAQTQAVLYTNPAFLGRLGYTDAEARALTLRDIFADGDAAPEIVLSRLRDPDSQMALNM